MKVLEVQYQKCRNIVPKKVLPKKFIYLTIAQYMLYIKIQKLYTVFVYLIFVNLKAIILDFLGQNMCLFVALLIEKQLF